MIVGYDARAIPHAPFIVTTTPPFSATVYRFIVVLT